jgi:glycosyltransferase involved in cell wall biosynthesis
VLFLGFTSMVAGAGTEQFLLQVLRKAPRDRYDLTLAETDFAPFQRWSPEYVERELPGLRRVRLTSNRSSADPDRLLALAARSRVLYGLDALALAVIGPTLGRRSRARNRAELSKIPPPDLVYLIRNEDRRLFERSPRPIVLGSTHCDDLSAGFLSLPALQPSRRLRRLLARYLRGPARGIDGYHVTQAAYWKGRMRRGAGDALIRLGVDTERFHPVRGERRPGPLRFLFVGSLDPMKGTDLLLDAWSRASAAEVELHVAGTGRLRPEVEARARADPRIRFHGVLSPEELAELYRSCDLFLFPSRFETLGLVVLEAAASGLHVLATNALRGAFDDLAARGYLEYVEPAAEPFRRRIEELAAHPPEYSEEARWSQHRWMVAEYDWARVARELFAWFDAWLARPRAAERG